MISELTTLKQNNENSVAWKNSGFLHGIHDENDIKNLIISYDSLYDYFITKDEIEISELKTKEELAKNILDKVGRL